MVGCDSVPSCQPGSLHKDPRICALTTTSKVVKTSFAPSALLVGHGQHGKKSLIVTRKNKNLAIFKQILTWACRLLRLVSLVQQREHEWTRPACHSRGQPRPRCWIPSWHFLFDVESQSLDIGGSVVFFASTSTRVQSWRHLENNEYRWLHS